MRAVATKYISYFAFLASVLAASGAMAGNTGSNLDTNGNIQFSIYPKPTAANPDPAAGTVLLTPTGGVSASGVSASGDVNVGGTLYALSGCTAGSLIVKKADGSLGCTDPQTTGTPLVLRQTGIIVGAANINRAFENDVAHIRSTTNDQTDINWLQQHCEAYANNGDVGGLANDNSCLINYCNGYFAGSQWPAMATANGECNANPHYDPNSGCGLYQGQPAIGFGCLYPYTGN